jgi:predicted transposase YbfD/YdcC
VIQALFIWNKAMSEIFFSCFDNLEDPRVNRTKKHLLLDIIPIAICAVIAGCEHWEEIEDFGNDHESWFKEFLTLENGIPSHDTFSRVFSILNPSAFQEACMNWLKMVHELLPESVIAIDGKTIRGSARKQSGLKGLHIINAWSCANSISLCQLKVTDKSNEITTVPEVLKLLELKGAIITMDAMGCQKESIQQICESDADYVVALKGNQGLLFDTATETFNAIDQGSKAFKLTTAIDEIDCEHGRIEQRKIDVVDTRELKCSSSDLI